MLASMRWIAWFDLTRVELTGWCDRQRLKTAWGWLRTGLVFGCA
jgi:hypothetical protein